MTVKPVLIDNFYSVEFHYFPLCRWEEGGDGEKRGRERASYHKLVTEWNNLPGWLRDIDSSADFRRALKTPLLKSAFPTTIVY